MLIILTGTETNTRTHEAKVWTQRRFTVQKLVRFSSTQLQCIGLTSLPCHWKYAHCSPLCEHAVFWLGRREHFVVLKSIFFLFCSHSFLWFSRFSFWSEDKENIHETEHKQRNKWYDDRIGNCFSCLCQRSGRRNRNEKKCSWNITKYANRKYSGEMRRVCLTHAAIPYK